MSNRTYQAGLLLCVFGGSLFAGGDQTVRELGLVLLFAGMAVGVAGLFRQSAPGARGIDEQLSSE